MIKTTQFIYKARYVTAQVPKLCKWKVIVHVIQALPTYLPPIFWHLFRVQLTLEMTVHHIEGEQQQHKLYSQV